MDKNIGKKLDGRYEITELIGVGGMADVYKGVDVIDGKPVAIKILKKEFAENEDFLRRFRNESKAIAVLSHPNIVKIYDVGFSEKIQYIVMEYIDGITLKEYIEAERVLTWKDTVHFVIQILRALQHAHDKGIVHRDIKPQNIMMFTDGTIKVMDFGIAKFAREEGKTATDQAIGSVHYISPEQARGDVTDEKSDIYSVGVMMYEMLVGQKPFDSENPVSIAVMHMHDIPVPPRSINPDIPVGLEEIVLKAMEKNPEDRYQSTTEMIADISMFKSNPDIVFGYKEETPVENTRYFQPVEQNDYVADDEPYDGGNAVQTGGNYDYNDDDDEEEEQRSSLVIPVLTAAVIVVIIVAVIFVVSLVSGLLTGSSNTNDYIMPDFYGMDYNDAVQMYGNNIQIQEDGYEYNELDSGCIFEQDIEPGTEFKKGDVVKVKISKGMETVAIPTGLTNMNAELAKASLKEIGLECEIKNASSSDVEKGNVIRTEPEEGTEVDVGSTIILYVSMGIDAEQVKVGSYVGKSIEDATALAAYQGLIVTTESVASYEKEGTVVEQSIEEGELVEANSEIVLKVSNGELPDGVIPFTVIFPDNAYGRFIIDFIVTDEDGKQYTFSTSTLIGQEMSSASLDINGSGEDVSVRAVLSNMNNNMSATIGEYKVNFATSQITVVSENVQGAFEYVGGIYTPTEAPTAAPEPDPTEAPYVEPATEAPYVEPATEAPYVEPEPDEPEPSDNGDNNGGDTEEGQD
jgi:serine/threonine-protein kinase